jgi:hypothetical protein
MSRQKTHPVFRVKQAFPYGDIQVYILASLNRHFTRLTIQKQASLRRFDEQKSKGQHRFTNGTGLHFLI